MSTPNSLEIFAHCLKNVPDPRSKQSTSPPFATVLALVFPGLLAHVATAAGLERRTKIPLTRLRPFPAFRQKNGRDLVPSDTTITRLLQKLSLDDLRNAFAGFLNGVLDEIPLVAAVDGQAAKSMKKGLRREASLVGEKVGRRFYSRATGNTGRPIVAASC